MPAVKRSAIEMRAARRQRIDDHVVRGRDQQRDDRGVGGDVDGVVGRRSRACPSAGS